MIEHFSRIWPILPLFYPILLCSNAAKICLFCYQPLSNPLKFLLNFLILLYSHIDETLTFILSKGHSMHFCSVTEASTTWFCPNEEFKRGKIRLAVADECCNNRVAFRVWRSGAFAPPWYRFAPPWVGTKPFFIIYSHYKSQKSNNTN